MYLLSRSRVKASMVLTRADHLFIDNYIKSLLNIILGSIFCNLPQYQVSKRFSHMYAYTCKFKWDCGTLVRYKKRTLNGSDETLTRILLLMC